MNIQRKTVAFWAPLYLVVALIIGACGQSPDGKPSRLASESEGAVVLNHMHQVNQMEIQIAELAKERASTQQIKDLADHLITDHQANDTKVMTIAKNMSINLANFVPLSETETLPEGFPESEAQWRNENRVLFLKLQGLNGEEFDKAFLAGNIDGHTKEISHLSQVRSSLSAGEIATFLDEVIPALQKHLEMAQGLQTGTAPEVRGGSEAPAASEGGKQGEQAQIEQKPEQKLPEQMVPGKQEQLPGKQEQLPGKKAPEQKQ